MDQQDLVRIQELGPLDNSCKDVIMRKLFSNQSKVGKSMRFTKDADASGTCFQGDVNATYAELISTFGKPEVGPNYYPDDEVTCEWVLQFKDGTVATVYDWKVYGPTPMGIYHWHIGGHSPLAVRRVKEELSA